MKTIISNASPLIILAKADLLEVLQSGFSKVLVPCAVVDEIKAGPADDPMRSLVDKLPWIEQVEIVPPLTPLAYWHLGRGESEVIEYARLHFGTIALLDDRAARKVAVALGIPVHGTLGVTAQSASVDTSFSFEIIVEKLRKAGLYVNNRVVMDVCNELNPKRNP